MNDLRIPHIEIERPVPTPSTVYDIKVHKCLGAPRHKIRTLMWKNINSQNLSSPRDDDDKTTNRVCDEVVKQALKKHGGKTFASYYEISQYSFTLSHKVFTALSNRLSDRGNQIREFPIWRYEPWVEQPNGLHYLHDVHISKESDDLVYTPNVTKLFEDRVVRIKPGRYLMKFYGPTSSHPVLSEAECKMWAEKYVASRAPAVLKFIPNTDPNGWEWVYENSVYSCMRYNREGRHLDSSLYGDNHPVRAYAHPKNDLALAYIMMPGEIENREKNCGCEQYVISARTIVNTRRKTFLRIYADDDRERAKILTELEKAEYASSSDTLMHQRLVHREYDDGIICPYLDGNYTNVDVGDDGLYIGRDGDYNAQQSSGLLNDERCRCDRCEEFCDNDDTTYIEYEERRVCQECLDNYYVYALVSARYGGTYDYIPEDGAVTVGDTSYSRDEADRRFLICNYCEEYRESEEIVELENGDFVCSEHTAMCDVSDEVHYTHDMKNTVDGLVYKDYVVDLWCTGQGAIQNCYGLKILNKVLYVHKDSLKVDFDDFVQCGSLLLPKEYYGNPVKNDFVPSNVVVGTNCEPIEDLIKSLEDDDEDDDEGTIEYSPFSQPPRRIIFDDVEQLPFITAQQSYESSKWLTI